MRIIRALLAAPLTYANVAMVFVWKESALRFIPAILVFVSTFCLLYPGVPAAPDDTATVKFPREGDLRVLRYFVLSHLLIAVVLGVVGFALGAATADRLFWAAAYVGICLAGSSLVGSHTLRAWRLLQRDLAARRR